MRENITQQSSVNQLIKPIQQFLTQNTPKKWLEHASKNIDLLLIDHAHCEKKAASTALRLLFRYDDKSDLLHKLSRLAREELRHFEQVLKITQQRDIRFYNLPPSNYAKQLIQHIRHSEPAKLTDHLIIGAIIEARSCERFAALIPYLDVELGKFYLSLLKSESRHFNDYLLLAKQYNLDYAEIEQRIAFFTELEGRYITSIDNVFRFHSGIPEQK